MALLKKILLISLLEKLQSGFLQSDEALYLTNWNSIESASNTAPLPNSLIRSCKRTVSGSATNYLSLPTITVHGVVSASYAQQICGSSCLCVISPNSTLIMDSSLNVAALLIYGSVIWNDMTQSNADQWLCAGYIVVENDGVFNMSITSPVLSSYIYLKDNGAVHPVLRTRAFGGLNSGSKSSSGPYIEITGRPVSRTWSLLAVAAEINSTSITLMHNPVDMGWSIGDYIQISPTAPLSEGWAETHIITSISCTENTIGLSGGIKQNFNADFINTGKSATLLAAEVINLSRNIVITGDDFRHISCDPTLAFPIDTLGCSCNSDIGRSKCTVGLHTIMSGSGIMKIQFARVEKCGQRGIKGKYCLHFHYLNECKDCLFRGNAIEYSQQRGIVVHETHLSRVEENVLTNVRGTGLFIEDGNEMYNKFMYNVVICPYPLDDPLLQGCTVPGTDNDQADTALNQAGLWSLTPLNDAVGNRMSNSFNGMFYDTGDFPLGQGGAYNHVNTFFCPMGRLDGNTFHGHGRFGTYILNYFPKQNCLPNITRNGWLTNTEKCTPFNDQGVDNGYAIPVHNSVDYGNAFVGGYDVGDVQYNFHRSFNNLNNIYWKETKNFNDGCSAHIANGHYAFGNMALPDMAAFIIENTIFVDSHLEAAHHCNIYVTGVLCMPTYVLSNVTWEASKTAYSPWVEFHVEANHYGGIFTLPPSDIPNTRNNSFFPPGYCSLTSSYWSYLLQLGTNTCVLSSNITNAWPSVSADLLGSFYSGGILCKRPVRSLKLYTHINVTQAVPLQLDIYESGILLVSFQVPFHSIVLTGKQGYSFPVVIRFLGIDGAQIKLFKIILTVNGQNCDKRVVTSQHDRRWLWADSSNYLFSQAWGRGACSSIAYPDMPTITCPAIVPVLPLPSCPQYCSSGCLNGYCDCGLKKCMCNPGFIGEFCEIDMCISARCGQHGVCTATYLGGTLPVSQVACLCDAGWSGQLCDQNPCLGQTCSGHGICQTVGDTDWRCICDPNYSGRLCDKTCMNFGCASNNFPFSCSDQSWGQAMYCLKGSGCAYLPINSSEASNRCCYNNCDICRSVTCPIASNDCHLAGSCQSSGKCSQETVRPDGSPCNSVLYGECQRGICLSTADTSSFINFCMNSTYSASLASSSNQANIVAIIGGTIGGLCLLVLISLATIVARRRQLEGKEEKQTTKEEESEEDKFHDSGRTNSGGDTNEPFKPTKLVKSPTLPSTSKKWFKLKTAETLENDKLHHISDFDGVCRTPSSPCTPFSPDTSPVKPVRPVGKLSTMTTKLPRPSIPFDNINTDPATVSESVQPNLQSNDSKIENSQMQPTSNFNFNLNEWGLYQRKKSPRDETAFAPTTDLSSPPPPKTTSDQSAVVSTNNQIENQKPIQKSSPKVIPKKQPTPQTTILQLSSPSPTTVNSLNKPTSKILSFPTPITPHSPPSRTPWGVTLRPVGLVGSADVGVMRSMSPTARSPPDARAISPKLESERNAKKEVTHGKATTSSPAKLPINNSPAKIYTSPTSPSVQLKPGQVPSPTNTTATSIVISSATTRTPPKQLTLLNPNITSQSSTQKPSSIMPNVATQHASNSQSTNAQSPQSPSISTYISQPSSPWNVQLRPTGGSRASFGLSPGAADESKAIISPEVPSNARKSDPDWKCNK